MIIPSCVDPQSQFAKGYDHGNASAAQEAGPAAVGPGVHAAAEARPAGAAGPAGQAAAGGAGQAAAAAEAQLTPATRGGQRLL